MTCTSAYSICWNCSHVQWSLSFVNCTCDRSCYHLYRLTLPVPTAYQIVPSLLGYQPSSPSTDWHSCSYFEGSGFSRMHGYLACVFLQGSLLIALQARPVLQWPHGLRRGSAAARLLEMHFRIPPRAWLSVSCKCCVFSGRGLCDGPIPRPEESHRVCCV